MIKQFYTAKDVAQILGYETNKAYSIIRELNSKLLKESEEQGFKIIVFPGRIQKDYFEKCTGISMPISREGEQK